MVYGRITTKEGLRKRSPSKKTTGSPRLRWEDRVKEDVEKKKARRRLEGISIRKERVETNMMDGMVLVAATKEE